MIKYITKIRSMIFIDCCPSLTLIGLLLSFSKGFQYFMANFFRTNTSNKSSLNYIDFIYMCARWITRRLCFPWQYFLVCNNSSKVMLESKLQVFLSGNFLESVILHMCITSWIYLLRCNKTKIIYNLLFGFIIGFSILTIHAAKFE